MSERLKPVQFVLRTDQIYDLDEKARKLKFANRSILLRAIIDAFLSQIPGRGCIVRCPECHEPLIQISWYGRFLKCCGCGRIWALKDINRRR